MSVQLSSAEELPETAVKAWKRFLEGDNVKNMALCAYGLFLAVTEQLSSL